MKSSLLDQMGHEEVSSNGDTDGVSAEDIDLKQWIAFDNTISQQLVSYIIYNLL